MTGVKIIDIHAAIGINAPTLLYDGCHPNEQGRKVIADTLASTIKPEN